MSEPIMGYEPISTGKNRHGCLTAYLVVMIIANSLAVLMYLLGSASVRQSYPDMPEWALPVLIVLGLFNLVCSIALFQWKKWGFWGFCATSTVAFVVNLSSGLGGGPTAMGLVGLLLLLGVLHIGKKNKGWPQLD